MGKTEKIHVRTIIDDCVLNCGDSEYIKRITRDYLVANLSQYLINKRSELPFVVTEKYNNQCHGKEICLDVTIIDPEEYRRLKSIESQYNRLTNKE